MCIRDSCTGVSFAHGSNDGQKGMGLIMLILVGTVPTAYALNHAVSPAQTADFLAASAQTEQVVSKYVNPNALVGNSRDELTEYIRTKEFKADTMLALRQYINEIGNEVKEFGLLKNVPSDRMSNLRNDMYVVSEALRLVPKAGKTEFTADDMKVLANYKKHIDPVSYTHIVSHCLGQGANASSRSKPGVTEQARCALPGARHVRYGVRLYPFRKLVNIADSPVQIVEPLVLQPRRVHESYSFA